MKKLALPWLNVSALEVLVRVIDPVGVGVPLPPITATATERLCAVVMLFENGVTVIVGVVIGWGVVTVTDVMPVALLYVDELALSGV